MRIVDGQEIRGRAIETAAYAAYTRGMLFELAEQYPQAAQEYETAAGRDPDSPELWTRLGRVRCHLPGQTGAARALAEAEGLDPEYAPLFVAKSECAGRKGQAQEALRWARHAAALDPKNPLASEALLGALSAAGQTAEALTWAISLALEHGSPTAWQRVATLAAKADAPAWAAHATDRASASRDAIAQSGGAIETCDEATRARLDAALHSGMLSRARSLANRCRLGPGALASRAAALGAAKMALAQALHVLAADPADGDARVALWVALDLSGDALPQAPAPPRAGDSTPTNPLSVRIMAEMLQRRAGDEAARAWLEAAPALPAAQDALERNIDARLHAVGIAARNSRPQSGQRRLRF